MKLSVVYSGWLGCKNGSCPTIYRTDEGDYVVQGYNISSADDIDIPEGESLVKLPKEFFEGFVKSVKD